MYFCAPQEIGVDCHEGASVALQEGMGKCEIGHHLAGPLKQNAGVLTQLQGVADGPMDLSRQPEDPEVAALADRLVRTHRETILSGSGVE
jgi:hypothetical protein